MGNVIFSVLFIIGLAIFFCLASLAGYIFKLDEYRRTHDFTKKVGN